MDILPLEIWDLIGNELAEDGSRQDLASLRLVNHLYCQIATPHLYRSLHLNTAQDDIDQLQVGGLGHPYLQHTRHLFVRSKGKPWARSSITERGIHQWGANINYRPSPTTEGGFLDARLTKSRVPDINSIKTFRGSWEPLASLIARFHCLKRLDFCGIAPFPATVQEALSHHPSCQLNLWAEHSVGYSEMAGERDPYSICRLLRCSNLHTLAIHTTWRNSTLPGWVNLTDQLPFIFVAPKLKNLVLCGSGEHMYAYEPYRQWEIFDRRWRELAARFEHAPVSRLETLTLASEHEMLLLRLSEAVDLSCLRTLNLHGLGRVELLGDISKAFPGLQRLSINMHSYHWPTTNVDNQQGISGLKLFPPLKFLTLRGLRQASSVLNILQRHGPSLKGLILETVPEYPGQMEYSYPKFTSSEVIQLASLAPYLEDLQIQCLRSKGNKAECDFYGALGHFQNLRKLLIELDCNVYHPPPESTAAQIQLMKDGFINATVDTKLALQVFSLITSHQPSGRLRKLRLAPFIIHGSNVDTLHHNNFLAKQVLVSRFPLRVEEVGKKEWEIFHNLIEPSRLSLLAGLDHLLDETLPFVPGREPSWDRYESGPLDVDDT
ncbi:hypothetical protein ASPVEDRAFT_29632 [Aspergillus versicolor CBS 583.65]|uniref:Uncharacterized protein n=1 Tax=Aspergillus versicolor CBS 583.65 TaxID=1036611 RepID=A0A1L9PNK0_ASPVE|nr:uncharacterized protein ASPVEDRAFT_29632 [Aspergillus versicolor CBS 583.65]OJJ03098.1 hypothetical protein ASPVEDRAFT_29632 [Aspergillus versicolor CBS 583.65]